MAREQVDLTLIDAAGNVQPGIVVTFTNRDTAGAASIYASESAGSPLAGNTATTDANGQPASGGNVVWVDSPGRYRAAWSGGSIDFDAGDPNSTSKLLADTKGDLLVASGADIFAVLGAGADYKVLRARAGATLGLEYAGPIEKRTSLPGSPYDGQVIAYQAATGVRWLFMYDSATSKWEFIGGPPLTAFVNTRQSTTNTSYVALGTALALTLALAGDYDITHGCTIFNSAAANTSFFSYDVSGTGGASAGDSFACWGGNQGNHRESVSMLTEWAGLAAGAVVTTKARVSAGTGDFEQRYLSIIPRRVA